MRSHTDTTVHSSVLLITPTVCLAVTGHNASVFGCSLTSFHYMCILSYNPNSHNIKTTCLILCLYWFILNILRHIALLLQIKRHSATIPITTCVFAGIIKCFCTIDFNFFNCFIKTFVIRFPTFVFDKNLIFFIVTILGVGLQKQETPSLHANSGWLHLFCPHIVVNVQHEEWWATCIAVKKVSHHDYLKLKRHILSLTCWWMLCLMCVSEAMGCDKQHQSHLKS